MRTERGELPLNENTRKVLSSENVDIDDIRRMGRQDFELLNSNLVGKITESERRDLIKFKLGLMNDDQNREFFQRTKEETNELKKIDPDFC